MERVRNRPRHEAHYSVITASELSQLQNSLQPSRSTQDIRELDQREREALRAKSEARVKNWPNTIEALRLRKEQDRKDRMDREEEARKALDLEEAQFQAAKREAAIERANLILYEQDDRIKALNSKMFLSNVLEERQRQVELKHQKEEMERQKEAAWHAQLQQQLWQQKQKEDDEAFERRQKAMEFKKSLKEQLHATEHNLLKTRKEAKDEGLTIRRAAEQAVQDDAEAERRRKEDAQRLAKEYIQHNTELKQIKVNQELHNKEEEAKIERFAKAKEGQMLERKRRQEEKFRNDMARRDAQISRQAEHLVGLQKQQEERVARQIEQVAVESENKEQEKREKREKEWAAIVESRNRQLSMKEAKKQAEAMEQAAFKTQRAMAAEVMQQEDQEERNWRRDQSARLQSFQIMQMEDKHAKTDAEKAQEKLEGEMMKKAMEEEEEMFNRYVSTVMAEYTAKGRNLAMMKSLNKRTTV